MTNLPAAVLMTLGRLMDAAAPSDEIALTNTMITTGLMWRCPCGATNAHDEDSDACSLCGADRLWAKDQTPPRYDYGELLADLRYALKEWFDDRPRARRPAAVSFRVTTVYDDGPAWATDGATAYFTDSSAGLAYPHDFDRSVVADSLAEVSEFDRPQTGDTLRVAIPVI